MLSDIFPAKKPETPVGTDVYYIRVNTLKHSTSPSFHSDLL
nr:MAG TPA: hypothetical protein [Caudoviricetes sp.]